MKDKIQENAGLTFDDVLLVPAKSDVLPTQVSVETKFTRKMNIRIPIVSAAMDTVTGSAMAIAMAQEGGIGVIHKNSSIQAQAAEVDRVKRSESGMIVNPITLPPDRPLKDALELMRKYRISGIPITEEGRLVGILTHRDIRFERNLDQPVSDIMTSENLITVALGTTLEQAKDILQKNRIEKLPVVDEHHNLKGLITIKDIDKNLKFPNA
jgi:IMP dehydrogenase